MHLQPHPEATMPQTANASEIDVRGIPPRERHALIYSTFRRLGAGAAFELVNDHDPRPLYYQFRAEMPGRFSWDYLQAGPDLWRVRIGKVAPAHDDSPCCGSCGGA
jgi:uncharacterized protein (DUF2249 family)